MRRIMLSMVVVPVVTVAGMAQQSSSPTFEVASIKVRREAGSAEPRTSPTRFVRTSTTLRQLLQYAYDRPPFTVVGGPEWVASERFDVDATSASPASAPQMRAMLRRLLTDRFALKTSTRMQEMSVYFLRLARRDGQLGRQIVRTTVDCVEIRAERLRSGRDAEPSRDPNARAVCTTFLRARPTTNGVALRYQTSGTSTGELASWVSPYVGRPVVDDTALDGEFDMDLTFAPSTGPSPTPDDPNEASSLFTAIQEQLGLKLEAGRAAVDVLMIDSVQRPTPD